MLFMLRCLLAVPKKTGHPHSRVRITGPVRQWTRYRLAHPPARHQSAVLQAPPLLPRDARHCRTQNHSPIKRSQPPMRTGLERSLPSFDWTYHAYRRTTDRLRFPKRSGVSPSIRPCPGRRSRLLGIRRRRVRRSARGEPRWIRCARYWATVYPSSSSSRVTPAGTLLHLDLTRTPGTLSPHRVRRVVHGRRKASLLRGIRWERTRV